MRRTPGTVISTAAGQRPDLGTLLAGQADAQIDLAVQIGVSQRLVCRLIARRLPAAAAAPRLRQREHTARRQSRTLRATTRTRCAWKILVTNVPPEQRSAHEAWVLRGVRWQSARRCKRGQRPGKLAERRGSQPTRGQAELYATFSGVLIQHWLLLAVGRRRTVRWWELLGGRSTSFP